MIGIERVILKHLPVPDEKRAYHLAERWQACGFTAEEADAWLTAGSRVEPGTATKLKAVGVTPREAFESLWRGHKITSDTLYSLVAENRMDLKEAGKFAEDRRARRRAG
jgi:hypothetical protein